MASARVRQSPSIDYFSTQSRQSQYNPNSNTISTSIWDSGSYSDSVLISSESCDSLLPSPTSPLPVDYPSAYALPKGSLSPERKPDQAFNFGTFEDWMRWDDPSDAAVSPTSDFFPELKLEPLSPRMSSLELQGSGISPINSALPEEGPVFVEDPMTEEPLFQTPTSAILPSPLADPVNRENLYSTPLSWSYPASGRRSQSLNSIQSQPQYTSLSASQESQLRNIAMPQTQSQNASTSPASPSSASSPEPENRRKRKSSVEDEGDDDESPEPRVPVKKTAHNMIEKRYRTNLNDKIAALRDSVPSLRVMSKKNSRGEDVLEDLQGLTPAHKLNKATVLSKATEYIAHLEKRNKYLTKENAALKSRVDAFEILVMSRQQQGPNLNMPQQQQVQQQQRQQLQRQQLQRQQLQRQQQQRGSIGCGW